MGRKGKILVIVLVSCLSASGYHVWQYYREQDWLAQKAQEIVRTAQASTREAQILALRDYIRRHVRYEGLSEKGRPFLRATAKETLETGKGFCGEATRAFIGLAHGLGIRAQRVNLYGRITHVVAEVELTPGYQVLIDLQDNPVTNPILDQRWKTLDEVIGPKDSLWRDYSNINLRRVPLLSLFMQRVRLRNTVVSWSLENPPLMKAFFLAGVGFSFIVFYLMDWILLRVYAFRLGLWPRRRLYGNARSRVPPSKERVGDYRVP